MSILSDREITELCTPPTFMVGYRHEGVEADYEDNVMRPVNKLLWGPTWQTRETLEAKHFYFSENGALAVRHYRELTDDERDRLPNPMISPFVPGQIKKIDPTLGSAFGLGGQLGGARVLNMPSKEVISFGLSSYGYDIRCSHEFKVFTNLNSTVVDPKNFDENNFVNMDASKNGYVIIPPNSFALSRTLEYFRIPRNVMTICLGKSTYARCGIIVNVTPFEPEWEGHVTLEFSNTTPLPAKIYANEGCAQVLFLQADDPCMVSYKDRKGKYQGQQGITLPKA